MTGYITDSLLLREYLDDSGRVSQISPCAAHFCRRSRYRLLHMLTSTKASVISMMVYIYSCSSLSSLLSPLLFVLLLLLLHQRGKPVGRALAQTTAIPVFYFARLHINSVTWRSLLAPSLIISSFGPLRVRVSKCWLSAYIKDGDALSKDTKNCTNVKR